MLTHKACNDATVFPQYNMYNIVRGETCMQRIFKVVQVI